MLENLRTMWAQAGAVARAGLVAGVLAIVVATIWFAASVMRADWQTLFADLDPQDAATMVAELEKMKVPYRLGADGTTIQVDRAQVHALRLKLLGRGGGLRGGVGLEIFNDTDFGMTEFAQKVNYQRALQGELVRTITALDEVRSARVHLVLPESGLFRKSGQRPKASITLAMKEGRALAPEQVLGIQRLVAAAVPEIEPGAVTIADQRGVTLTRPGGGDGDDALAGRLGVKADVEAYFARKLVALFDRAMGPGRVIVSVDVTIDHDHVKVTREDVLPLGRRDGGAVGAVARQRSSSSGERGAAAAAPPGVAGAPAAQADATGTAASSSEVEYLNGRRVEQVVSTPGSIKRLSVGIVLPNVADRAQLDKIRQLVSTTVGANPARGDEIAIASLDLPPGAAAANTGGALVPAEPGAPAPEDAARAVAPRPVPGRGAQASPGVEWLLGGLVAVALAALVAFLLGRGRRAAPPLTPQARDEVLAKVQAWLRQGEAA
ncbi:MAG: flagellar basal-body MS-ring/collar protein FliF [Burkholderiaceae bacterium]